jgi:predicted unusual protein kinase regulating ubiquinone biosynthesis (AarF/ABC1/UbiB family)
MRNWEHGLQLGTLGHDSRFKLTSKESLSAGSFSQIMRGTNNRAPVIVKMKRWKIHELSKRDVLYYISLL